MARMGSEGLFILEYPEHPYSQAVREVAAQLLRQLETGLIGGHREEGNRMSEFDAVWPPELQRTMPEVLALPDEARTLVTWLLRQGEASLSEVAALVEQDEDLHSRSARRSDRARLRAGP